MDDLVHLNADIEDDCAIYKRTEFLLPDCGYYLKPRQGTVIFLDCSKIKHGSIENEGYKQYGVAITYKKSVLTTCKNDLEKTFGNNFRAE